VIGQQRVLASKIGFTTAVVAVSLGLSSGAASATTRLRSGTVHAQLASHVSSAAGTTSSGLVVSGANVMGIVVGTLALLALAYIVVTLIRRRITA
jgi:hypothetical protein